MERIGVGEVELGRQVRGERDTGRDVTEAGKRVWGCRFEGKAMQVGG